MKSKNRAFRLHNFGASIGGPIIRDKTHFFFSYEGNRQTNYLLGGFTDSLPITAFNTGDFSRLLDQRVSGCCPVLNIDNYSTSIDHILNAEHTSSWTT